LGFDLSECYNFVSRDLYLEKIDMSERIEFTRNYSDLSTNQGFQFEFQCDRCGTGYRTRFQGSALGTAATALNTASNIFGGLFNSL